MADEVLTDHDQQLLDRYLRFYRSLISGKRVAQTAAQVHFVEAFHGRVAPETDHEIAFMKFIRIELAKREAESERAAVLKAERDLRIDDEPGMRAYPSRLDKNFDNAKFTSRSDYR